MNSVFLVNGCFDLFHIGHSLFLDFAKTEAERLGCKLLVAVNDDLSVRNLKGAGRPIRCQEERIAWVRNYGYNPILFDGDVEKLINNFHPVVVVRGYDQKIEPFLKHWLLAPKLADISTTELLSKMGR